MNQSTSFLPELQNATGHFDYPLTNDYMFRVLCQKNNKALTGFISALLRIPIENIHSVVIMNLIILGDACEDKEFRLDLRVVLNEKMIMNEKTHRIYSDKFALNVLDLNKVELATDDDREWKLDYWACLFKATTWEEIKMIASNDDYLKEASNTLYLLNEDFNIRERCRNRVEYYKILERYESMIEKKDAEIQQLRAERDMEIKRKDMEIKQLYAELERLKTAQRD